MFRRKIFPPLEDLDRLRQPLTEGERMVLELFHRRLSVEWEIYIQPHLNGLRPDVVLLNPRAGIAVFEVKDWDLDAMDYSVAEKYKGYPVLVARKDGRLFSIEEQNPISKVEFYKKAIYELYCPRLEQRSGFGAITAGVIFPFASAERVKALFSPFTGDRQKPEIAKYHPIAGSREVATGDIRSIFPESSRRTSQLMRPELADDLRGWLEEPDFARMQREPLKLDAEQRKLITEWPASRYRRIKGPAGSGKSMVLAARAAMRANAEKTVLILTFNITLWHYLRDLIVRSLHKPVGLSSIWFDHFHHFCKIAALRSGYHARYVRLIDELQKTADRATKDRIMNVEIPQLASEAFETGKVPTYDTIMVDEGQDYRPDWWPIIRKALKPGGEVLLVADVTQDIYGTGKAWTEQAMTEMGFSGRWARLGKSYRLPEMVQDYAGTFAKIFIDKDRTDLPDSGQSNLEPDSCTLRWVQCEAPQGTEACIREIIALMRRTGANGTGNADITFLTDDTNLGDDVVRGLTGLNINAVSTFNEDYMERRREKIGFFMGDARIKATTPHSFKGWETRLLVVYVSQFDLPESKAVIYAALTRLKRSPQGSFLTVVCSANNPELIAYGRTWPEHNQKPEPIVLFHATSEALVDH
ncbi:NERD domain-containing protein [Roseicella sp. DB1501]|uniref:NERD domain-containing protein n=1 Tax=Roseicella sp. DB1501 TaxID=2730925 RepID=UPI001491E846|nr:NERD domain-containing protein [Roseicella sp. DB1501]NOG70501.1 AAA family ATPase [Roseicella sp. DB1501]